jgi:hypothetical protein
MLVSGEGLAAVRAKYHFECECVVNEGSKINKLSSDDLGESRIAKARETVS